MRHSRTRRHTVPAGSQPAGRTAAEMRVEEKRDDAPGKEGVLLSLHTKVNDQFAPRQTDAAERHPPDVAAGYAGRIRHGQGTLRNRCSRAFAVPAAVWANPTLAVAGRAHDAHRNLDTEHPALAGLRRREAHLYRDLVRRLLRRTPRSKTTPPLIQNAIERSRKGLVEEGALLAEGRPRWYQRLDRGTSRAHGLWPHGPVRGHRQPALRLLSVVGLPQGWIAQYFVGLL